VEDAGNYEVQGCMIGTVHQLVSRW